MKKLSISKQDVNAFLKLLAVIAILSFIRAITNYVFIIPNGFAPGGINGVASIIYNAVLPFDAHLANTVFNPAITGFVLNIPLLIAAFLVLDKRFAFNTLIAVGMFSLWMGIFSLLDFPVYKASTMESGYNLLAAVAGGAGSGVCLGFILRNNACMGGTDIIGKLIYKHDPVTDVQWIILLCDSVVVVASGALGFIGLSKDAEATAIVTALLTPVLYSAVSLITGAEVADVIQSGLQSSLIFNIVSDKHVEISDAITTRSKRGVTVIKASGFYTGVEHNLLVCVVRKRQINQIKDIIKEIDPAAFVYISKAREVTGKGFTSYS